MDESVAANSTSSAAERSSPRRTQFWRHDMCHARERERPEYHDATRFAALRRSRRLPGLHRSFVMSPRLDPAFAGMTRVGLEGGDEAVVSWRRLRPRSARVVRGADR